MSNAASVRQQIAESVTPDDDALLVDLSDLSFIDSAGLHALIELGAVLDERRQQLLLCVPHGSHDRAGDRDHRLAARRLGPRRPGRGDGSRPHVRDGVPADRTHRERLRLDDPLSAIVGMSFTEPSRPTPGAPYSRWGRVGLRSVTPGEAVRVGEQHRCPDRDRGRAGRHRRRADPSLGRDRRSPGPRTRRQGVRSVGSSARTVGGGETSRSQHEPGGPTGAPRRRRIANPSVAGLQQASRERTTGRP